MTLDPTESREKEGLFRDSSSVYVIYVVLETLFVCQE